MPDYKNFLDRALGAVEGFSDQHLAILPETPPTELLNYVAHITGDDVDKLRRLYQIFVSVGRLDSFGRDSSPGAGFAED